MMKDRQGRVIYVGKARSLKSRVRQYFQNPASRSPKTAALMAAVSRIESIVTDNEVEALILECNLIKKYRPKYNIMLRDDKSYPYIRISVQDPYPGVFFTRSLEKGKGRDGARYFGPYPGARAVRDTLDMLGKIFPIRTCSRMPSGRACLSYHLGRCVAPCLGHVDTASYRLLVEEMIGFLEGRQHRVVTELKAQMREAAETMDYEKAAILRDRIAILQRILEKQKVVSPRLKDCDAVVCAFDGGFACFQVYQVRDGRLIGRENHMADSVDAPPQELLADFLARYYEPAAFIPPEILTDMVPEGIDALCEWLTAKRGGKTVVTAPKIGGKRELMDMFRKNAALELDRYRREEGRIREERQQALETMAARLGLEHPPAWIEAYDVSHLGSDDMAASRVVFLDGQPATRHYRRYRIRSISGPDDCAAIREVVGRRLSGEEPDFPGFPDLILVDGGAGQVCVAEMAVKSLSLAVPVAGMVKDRDHRTERLLFHRTVFPLKEMEPVFRLIAAIQEEAHRFALKYSQTLRSGRQVRSALDAIPGIGKARRLSLLRRFGSLQGIRDASEEEIAAVTGEKVAGQVYITLHPAADNRPVNRKEDSGTAEGQSEEESRI